MVSTSPFGHWPFIWSISAPMLLTCKMIKECQELRNSSAPQAVCCLTQRGSWDKGGDGNGAETMSRGDSNGDTVLLLLRHKGHQQHGTPQGHRVGHGGFLSCHPPSSLSENTMHPPTPQQEQTPPWPEPMGNVVMRTQPPCETFIPGRIVSFCFLHVQRKQIREIRGKKQIYSWHAEQKIVTPDRPTVK